MHAFVDESIRKGEYIVCAVLVAAAELDQARKALRALRRPGQRRIHFVHESDRRRRQVLSALARGPIRVAVYRSDAKDAEQARRRCLQQLVHDESAQLRRLVLESRGDRDANDQSVIHVARYEASADFGFDHLQPHEEPLLWAADAIAWAVGIGGDWARRVQPVITNDASL